jgi:hypothetical protein
MSQDGGNDRHEHRPRWSDPIEFGPVHLGMVFLYVAFHLWFLTDDSSAFFDWLGFGFFLAGCRLWSLDPPRPALWRQPLGMFLGVIAAAYGWWFQRLPIVIAGAFLAVLLPARLLRRILGR